MKCLRRCLSVFLLCVLLLGAFSVTANAATIEVAPYHIFAQSMICNASSCQQNNALTFYPNNGTEEKKSLISPNTTAGVYRGNQIHTIGLKREIDYTIATDNGSPLIKKGNSATVNVSKLYNAIKIKETNTNVVTTTANVITKSVYVVYTDNSSKTLSSSSITNFTSNIDYEYSTIEFSLTPDKDVKNITIRFVTPLSNYVENSASATYTIEHFVGEYLGDNTHIVSISQQSEEAGLLSGLIEWVKNISNTVSGGFQSLVSGITELPNKLWTAIENGLKGLFVPDAEFMAQNSENWDTLLSNRFGAIYQSGTIIQDFFADIQNFDNIATIEIPLVSLESAGIPFEFGGYEVSILPSNKFLALKAAAQGILGFIFTALFINGLRKRYDKIMGG